MSSGEATRSDNGTQGPPQDRNQSKMDAIEDLRKKLQELEKRNLELASKHNQDMSHYEKDLMKLRLELERGEALRRVLESEMFFARKDAQVQMYSAEDEICEAKAKLLELQDTFQPPVSPSAFNAPAAPTPTPEDTSQPPVSPPSASAPAAPAPAPEVHQGDPRHRTYALSATDIPSDGTLYITRPEPGTDATIESFQLPFVPQEISTSEGPAPDVHSGQPGHRTYVLSGSDIPSGGTPYRTYTLPGTDTASESIRSYFVTQGISTSRGPPSDGRWGQPEQRTYIFSGSDISSGRTPYRTYTLPGMDTTSESFQNYFVPQGISTSRGPASDVRSGHPGNRTYVLSGSDIPSEYFPLRFVPQEIRISRDPAPDASWRGLSAEVFPDRSESEFDQSYSQYFQPLRPTTLPSAAPMRYRVSGSDSYDSSWVYCRPSEISSPIPSGRSDRTYHLPRQTLTTYVPVMPSRIETLSWLDDSSRIRPLSTFTMSTPSWERIRAPVGAPVHPPAPVNTSFSVRRRRSHSLPPFRSDSQGSSPNTRRIQEI
ncbi:uncharacterized protein LOC130265554 [Oenanthe melanoleuca]|uniref:uncharacterized protein LOC130265554 n=1 Tax=Oenanthe melanoleuca TaxID=2939378 RepID=UPI0024C1A1F8|nr:uncharacterized protein LOC130265554 [Oenanthe melanoleuca]